MRITILNQPQLSRNQILHKLHLLLVCAFLFLLPAAAALLGTIMLLEALPLAAQASVSHPASSPVHKPLHLRKRLAHQATPPVEAIPAPVTPPAPELPQWPANDKPAEASVVWDSQGLRVDAANSSLAQILKDISTATGTAVEGFDSDKRVFGVYGPGQARDILSQLLQGSGYNLIMIGDQGAGVPRKIVLSVRKTDDKQTTAKNNQASNTEDDPDSDDTSGQPVPIPMRPGFAPRTPQQIMQEMQERRQQQQQQQLNPPTPQN
jgi:hypothetical protein